MERKLHCLRGSAKPVHKVGLTGAVFAGAECAACNRGGCISEDCPGFDCVYVAPCGPNPNILGNCANLVCPP